MTLRNTLIGAWKRSRRSSNSITQADRAVDLRELEHAGDDEHLFDDDGGYLDLADDYVDTGATHDDADEFDWAMHGSDEQTWG